MPKARQHAATAGGTPDDVETAFYEALRTADVDALMACWADEDDIVCIHPGGARISGVAAIRAAFDAIFSHGGAIQVRPESIRHMDAVGGAVHSVLERMSWQPMSICAHPKAGAWFCTTPVPASKTKYRT